MLYLALDNSLQDCSELPNGDIGDTELVQDYKRLCRLMATAIGNKVCYKTSFDIIIGMRNS